MSDLLSVVIPTHNRPAELGRLLASVVAPGSSQDGLEVIVVDDGSAEGLYDDLMTSFPQVTWIREPQSGPATARNKGWRASTGDMVVFVDDDCVLDPAALPQLRKALASDDAVGATIEPLHRGRLIADFMHAEHLVTHKVQDGQVRWLVTACLGVRRSALELLGGFDEQLVHPRRRGRRPEPAAQGGGAPPRRIPRRRRLPRPSCRAVRSWFAPTTATGPDSDIWPRVTPNAAPTWPTSTRSRLSPRPGWTRTGRYRREEDRLTSSAFVGPADGDDGSLG